MPAAWDAWIAFQAMLWFLVMSTGARVHARVGGLAHDDVKGEDGLR